MIRLLMIIFFSIGCSVLNAQSTLNTKEFFPIIDSSYKELFQKIQITSEDSIQFVYHSYEYINISNNQYLISKTFDSDSLLTTY